jgi:hypothetical protein
MATHTLGDNLMTYSDFAYGAFFALTIVCAGLTIGFSAMAFFF